MEPYNSLLWPFDSALDRIDHRHTQFTGLVCPFVYSHQESFSENGIRVSANLWEVKDKIDMTPIQQMWSGKWNALTRMQTHMAPKNVEDIPDYVRGYISMRDKTPKDAYFLEQMKRMSNFEEYPGEWPFGTKVCKPLLEQDVQAQKVLGDMIFAVIRHLYLASKESDSEMSSYALSLANAIWQSVGRTVEPMTALPDIVGDWVFSHQAFKLNSYKMLDMDATPDGNLAQVWFLERIMRDGFLWVGRYVATATTDQRITSTTERMHELRPRRQPVLNPINPIAMRQIARNRAASFERSTGFDNRLTSAQHTDMAERRNAVIAEAYFYGEWNDEDEKRRSRDHASLFDVDGPCLVAVPFNGAWEVLPRPSTRAMSICWVVERSSSKSGKEKITGELGDEEEEFRITKKVKGLFEFMSIPRGRYIFS